MGMNDFITADYIALGIDCNEILPIVARCLLTHSSS